MKLNVLTRYAAYGCPLPRDIYDQMNSTGSPIALRLFDVQRKSIEELWQRCNAEGEVERAVCRDGIVYCGLVSGVSAEHLQQVESACMHVVW